MISVITMLTVETAAAVERLQAASQRLLQSYYRAVTGNGVNGVPEALRAKQGRRWAFILPGTRRASGAISRPANRVMRSI